MKITIEPTEEHAEYPNATVVISYPTDDVECEDAIEMVLNALVSWGYSHDVVFEDRESVFRLEARIKELEELNVRLPDEKIPKRSTSNARSK